MGKWGCRLDRNRRMLEIKKSKKVQLDDKRVTFSCLGFFWLLPSSSWDFNIRRDLREEMTGLRTLRIWHKTWICRHHPTRRTW